MSDWISTFPGYEQVLTTAKKIFGKIVQTGPVPRHVGIIMDGNRRYARINKIEIKEGHSLGFDTMASVLELLYESGVECATVYAFSIENFKRSNAEVKWLMDLAKLKFEQINQHADLCEKYGVKIKVLGNKRYMPPDVARILRKTEELTKNNKRATLNVCFPYTSRDEMVNSIKRVVDESTKNHDLIIDESAIDRHLYTSDSPPLDLLIRTSGTYRLSDFLLWQCVSPDCSLVIVDQLWPAFRPWHMAKVLLNYSFNKYWFGHGNGYTTSNKGINLYQSSSVIDLNDGKSSSGYQRYADSEWPDEDESEEDGEILEDIEEEEEEEESSGNSSGIERERDDEVDTVTSSESDSNKKY
ncbi:putative undecaprenyl diphosphate synthase-domain-containing protein [Scheffersomyces coipomensis]|uniref:putative undecaprenyl diphosphate synthase-domain-containing protein n=1 Tax=Scheffersomyces coipomensis TaxID=1788519 RepID=UPI00315CCF85